MLITCLLALGRKLQETSKYLVLEEFKFKAAEEVILSHCDLFWLEVKQINAVTNPKPLSLLVTPLLGRVNMDSESVDKQPTTMQDPSPLSTEIFSRW
jgi:hypothetical protein